MNTNEKSISNQSGPDQPSEDITNAQDKHSTLPVTVGIGASAGGHEALEIFFSSIPHDTGFSFIVIMHLPKDGPSLLTDIIRHHTSLKVHLIENGMALAANTVYVPPPGSDFTIHDGLFHIHFSEDGVQSHHSIDRFFTVLADELEQQAIAVLLSGYGSDGSIGIRRIKEKGGIVLVQDPQTAINPFMPQNAINTGLVDWILSEEEIAEKLCQISKETILFPAANEDELRSLFAVLKARTTHDFSSYKKNTVLRRIQRRMVVNSINEFNHYLDIIKNNPNEAYALCHELLIGVTSFFRDREAFAILRDTIIPSLFVDRDPNEAVRIWHACCATGEEAYSVAILILEHLEQQNLQAKVQIFATDLDETAIAHARAGIYPEEISDDVNQELLQKYFTRNNGYWQVSKQLREMIVFAQHNIIKDPPFSRLDLLVCRNFLIYLNPDIQRLLVPLFHQVLNPKGILFLGSAETIGHHGDLFAAINKKWKIFMRQGSNRQVEALFPFAGPVRKYHEIEPTARATESHKSIAITLAEKLLLDRYVPARIIINEKNEVVHFSSQADAYLVTPEGEPTKDLLKLVREELRPPLRAATYKAFTTQTEIAYHGVKAVTDHGEQNVNIIVVPLKDPQISFKQALVIIEPAEQQAVSPASVEDSAQKKDSSRNSLTRQLEEQLRVTSDQLQSTCEQLEASNERFMLANEELMTVNEELQSSNEELQSTNEELVTVNSELQRKMEELNQSNSDLENLLSSSEIATFFLSPELTIEHYSPAMATIFNLTSADLGRSIRLLDSIIDWSGLPQDAASVMKHLLPVEREVTSTKDGRIFIKRVLPYKTTEGCVDGIVITLVDISERKRNEAALLASEKALREGDERLRFALETCHIGAWDLNLEDQTAYRSLEQSRIFGYPELLPDWNFNMFMNHILPEDRGRVSHTIQMAMKNQTGWDFECRIRRADDAIRWIWVAGRPNVDAFGNRRIAGLVQDITARKEIEEENSRLLAVVQFEKERLTSLINSITSEVWFADTDKKFTLTNPSALEAFGLHSMNEVDVEHFAAKLEVFRADGSPRPVGESPMLRALSGEVVKNLEEIIRNPVTGELRNREVNANAVRNDHGEIIGAVAVVSDITDRKSAEKALQESQTRLEAALASMTDAVFISDVNGQFIEFNDAFANFHKFETKDACLKRLAEYPTILEVYTSDGELAALEQWAVPRALRGETATNAEYTLRLKDTGETWVGSYSFSPIRDNEGEIIGSVVVGRDITEMKRKDEALRQSEQLYRSLFDNMLNGFAYCQMIFEGGEPEDFIYITVNRAFEMLTGLKNVAGKKVSEAIPGIRNSDPELFAMYGRVASTGIPERFEYHLKALDM